MSAITVRLLNIASPELPLISALVRTDPESRQQLPMYGRPENWNRLIKSKHKILGGYDETGALVGFLDFTIGLSDGASTIAYWVAPKHRGEGHGTRIVAEGVRWVQRHLRLSTFRAFADEGNAASLRVLESNGFVRFGGAGGLGHWTLTLAAAQPAA